METSFERRRKFGRERPKKRRKINDHVGRDGAYTPLLQLDLFGAVVAGGRFDTFLEYVLPNSMERLAAAKLVDYVSLLNGDFWTESTNFPTVGLEL